MNDDREAKTITEPGLTASGQFINKSVEQYIQTVVLIDDQIYERDSGRVVSTQAPDDSEEPGEASFYDVQKSFATKRIICSLYQPEKDASFNDQSEAYKLSSTADVIIVDWDLGDTSGEKATELVGSLIEKSQTEIPHQLRLILIYTLEQDLQGVANHISIDLVQRRQICVDTRSEDYVLKTENTKSRCTGKTSKFNSDRFLLYRACTRI